MKERMMVPEWMCKQEWYDEGAVDNGFAGVVNGKNIFGTWEYDPDGDGTIIEQVMRAQGFLGKPRVVDASEFEGFARAALGGEGLVMQRGYGADSAETLLAYKKSLYSGEWYVNSDDALYGSGMYAMSSIGAFAPSSDTGYVANAHAEMHGSLRRIETMTMDETATAISYDALTKAMMSDEIGSMKAHSDEGVYAAMMGYDIIIDKPTGQTVVLNRTKLIIANT